MNERKQLNLRKLALAGLWRDNPSLVQLLGLCPLLAVTESVVKALGIGLATLPVLVLSNATAALLRHSLPAQLRLLFLAIPIATLGASVEWLVQAHAFDLHVALGIFLPLIASNCLVLARADLFASRHGVRAALVDGLGMGVGALLALLALGALRELTGTGALFGDMQLLFGDGALGWRLQLFEPEQPFQLALLPPAGFIFLGLLIAAKNVIDNRRAGPNSPDTTL
jgi:electron transport complex protein RnfE